LLYNAAERRKAREVAQEAAPVRSKSSSPKELNLGDDFDEIAKAHQKKKRAAKKKKKKEKKTSNVLSDEVLLASLHAGGRQVPTDEQLAELAEQARQAMQQASQLAGEPVAYIAAMIIPARLVRENSPFRRVEEYKIINGW
jgi:hypothetical protein